MSLKGQRLEDNNSKTESKSRLNFSRLVTKNPSLQELTLRSYHLTTYKAKVMLETIVGAARKREKSVSTHS